MLMSRIKGMTLEEAIKNREDCLKYLEGIGRKASPECMEAVRWSVKALKAIHPVSREQVEKVWTGCDICGGDKKIKSDNFCGAATMRIVGDSIDLRGDEKKIKFFGHIYAPSFSVKFCPFCGKPLTDEAVDIRLKELEALKDDQT